MKNNPLFGILPAAALLLFCGSAHAQQSQQPASPSAPAKQEQKPQAKAKHRKVWTNDDMDSLRTPASDYADLEQVQAAAAAAATAAASAGATQPVATKPPVKGASPVLSNPKSSEEAGKMIAWEDRDVAAQQEYVDKVQKQLEDAPPDQKERLQKLLQERQQILSNTIKERQSLQDKKKDLEKKPASGQNNDTVAAAQPPQQ